LIAFGAFVAVLILAIVLALNSGVQTWAAAKPSPASPASRLTLGFPVSAGLNRIELKDVRAVQNGAVDHAACAHRRSAAAFRRPVAKGNGHQARGPWVDGRSLPSQAADPSRTGQGYRPARLAAVIVLLASAYAADPAAAAPAVAALFQGYSRSSSSRSISSTAFDLDGDIILPPATGGAQTARAHLTLAGGGLGAGRDGRFNLT